MLLDTHIPDPDFTETHRLPVNAETSDVAAAVREVTPAELPFLRSVTGARKLPAAFTGQQLPDLLDDAPLLDQLERIGFVPLDEGVSEFVWGIIGKLWRVRPEFAPVRDADEFAEFDRKGWARAAWNLTWAPAASAGATEIRTETRVALTDRLSRVRFAPYWYTVKPAGGKIRRELLEAVARRAEESER